jgi:hypothetical protein
MRRSSLLLVVALLGTAALIALALYHRGRRPDSAASSASASASASASEVPFSKLPGELGNGVARLSTPAGIASLRGNAAKRAATDSDASVDLGYAQGAIDAKDARIQAIASLAAQYAKPAADGTALPTPAERVIVARQADPPFGPTNAPIKVLTDPAFGLRWEKEYYERHPDEYALFVERWGDLHALR